MPPDDLSRRLDEVHWSTERLLAALRHPPRDEAHLSQPSLLPGWTRAHVLGHLARNADALVRTLEGTRRGERVPMYAGEAERAADIEADRAARSGRAGRGGRGQRGPAGADLVPADPAGLGVRGGHPDRAAAGPAG